MLHYIENNLLPGEVILSKARKSNLLMLRSILLAILALVIGMAFNDSNAMVIAVLVAVLLVAMKWLDIRQYELAVTNRKVVAKAGLISKKVQECPLDKIDNVTIQNGILGAMFGYGTVEVKAVNGTFSFSYITKAADFKNAILSAINANQEEQAVLQAQKLAAALRGAALV